MRLFLIILSCLLYTGCASSVSQKSAPSWSYFAQQAGISEEDAESIAIAATKAHNLVVVTMLREEDGSISVYLAKSRTDSGGFTVFFKKMASGWLEDKGSFSTWSEKKERG